jgi:tRNA/tmRNA/rRNA uracil-C5-methylase (TrmA/RlmC/RlmD family)
MINLTLFVQIGNFWITYAVMHKFLFKPFVSMIIRKQEASQKILKGLKEKEEILTNLQEDKAKHLTEFKLYLKKRYVVTPPSAVAAPAEAFYQADAQVLEQLTQRATQLIIQEVEHAR